MWIYDLIRFGVLWRKSRFFTASIEQNAYLEPFIVHGQVFEGLA